MSTYESTVAAKQTENFAAKLKTTELGGRVRIAHGSLPVTSALASGSVIELVKLPKGARLLPMSQIHFEAGQSASLTVKVGDADDDDRYFAAATPGASATSITLNANRLNDYVTTGESMVKLTTGGASTTATKKITFDIMYVVD